MSRSAKRLGRGLDSLVSNLRAAIPKSAREKGDESAVGDTSSTSTAPTDLTPSTLPIDALDPNQFQPRSSIDSKSVLSLAASIKQSGLLQPIAVRRQGDRYQIIAGERRWRAAQSIGLLEVPVIVRETTDEEMLELALVENIHREDLNAIDRARAYREFCDRFSLKPEEVARRVGEDRTTVVNYLRLLDLSSAIQEMVAQGWISMGHARCLLGVADTDRRLRLAESARENGLSVRALEEIVRREKTRSEPVEGQEATIPQPRAAHIRDLERQFETAVGTKVTIHEGPRKSTGRVILRYYSLDDFDRIAELLGVKMD